jgi:hypothetical protein
VEKTSNGLRSRLIEREGPIGVIVTTTAPRLHPENETRMVSITVSDSAGQTQAVLRSLAQERGAVPVIDLDAWRALQVWIGAGDNQVVISFAATLAELIPPVAVRLRRDFGAVLNFVRAHALLHQATRARSSGGAVVATIGDYAAVRDLIGDIVAEGVEATVPPRVRETVDAVRRLADGSNGGVPLSTLAAALGLDKSAASRRVREAVQRGYLLNQEDRKGRPARLVIGDPMSEELGILPAPDLVKAKCCSVALPLGKIESTPSAEGTGGKGEGAEDFFALPPLWDVRRGDTKTRTLI